MPLKSRWSVEIPVLSLPSLILGSPDDKLPDTLAYCDADSPDKLQLSLAQFALWSRRVAAGLLKAGLQPQDRVLVYSGNNIFFPVVFMGVIMAGGIISTANPAFVARELAHQLTDSEPRFVLVAEGSVETALQAAKMVHYRPENMFIFDDEPLLRENDDYGSNVGQVRHWKHLIATAEEGKSFRWEQGNTKEFGQRTVAILYSSGTTGVPKGVEITHYSLVANCCQLDFIYSLDPRFARDKSQRSLCMLPMYHGLGLLQFSTVCLYRRIPVYIMKRYSLQGTLSNIQRFRISELVLVPPMAVALAKSPEARSGKYDLSSVQKISCGAAPLSREMCAELEKLWPEGKINVKQGWGMTELATSVLNWDERQHSSSQAVGEPVPNCQVKLMDDDGLKEVPQGQRGELWALAPNKMKGYWRRPEATKETVTEDGWLKTGDIAFQDKDGKIWIVDRKKELIKVKGNQVAPAELEGLLLEHPEIQDAAVIGLKVDEDERPFGYIVRAPNSILTAEDILGYMKEKTARVKWLCGIEFTSSIPKNPSGKILRRQLRELAAQSTVRGPRVTIPDQRARL